GGSRSPQAGRVWAEFSTAAAPEYQWGRLERMVQQVGSAGSGKSAHLPRSSRLPLPISGRRRKQRRQPQFQDELCCQFPPFVPKKRKKNAPRLPLSALADPFV